MSMAEDVALEVAESRRGTGAYPDMVLDWWIAARGRLIRRSPRSRVAYRVRPDLAPEYDHPGSLRGAAIACRRVPPRGQGDEPRLAFLTAQAMEWADL